MLFYEQFVHDRGQEASLNIIELHLHCIPHVLHILQIEDQELTIPATIKHDEFSYNDGSYHKHIIINYNNSVIHQYAKLEVAEYFCKINDACTL